MLRPMVNHSSIHAQLKHSCRKQLMILLLGGEGEGSIFNNTGGAKPIRICAGVSAFLSRSLRPFALFSVCQLFSSVVHLQSAFGNFKQT